MGKLVGDLLQCRYHGLRFDPDGRCVRIPGQDKIPSSAKVKVYPVVERYKWLWIWMGQPALADPATITDFHRLDDPNWGAKNSYLHVKANWQLIVDNLLDLTHLAFVHETTIGNAALAEHATVKVTRTSDNVVMTRWIIDQDPPPTFRKIGGFTGKVDRWQIIDFTPPAFLRLDVGATPTGTGAREGRRVGGITMRNLNAITPETDKTLHYFWAQAHDFDVKNPEVTNKIFVEIDGLSLRTLMYLRRSSATSTLRQIERKLTSTRMLASSRRDAFSRACMTRSRPCTRLPLNNRLALGSPSNLRARKLLA
jgi:phenylpropionate dioxygenase-like ring-hydroxylating dioxygenase large terminal subunit